MDSPDPRCLTDKGLARYRDPGPRPLMRSPAELDEYFRLCRELYLQAVRSGYSQWMLDNLGGVLALAAPDAAGIYSAALVPMWGPDTVIDHSKLRAGAYDWWSGHEQVMRDSIAAGVDVNTAIQDYFDREADSDAPTIEELRQLTTTSAPGTLPAWQTEVETVKARARRTLAAPHDAPLGSAAVGAAMLTGVYPIPETPEEVDVAHHNMAVIEAVGGPIADLGGARGIASTPLLGTPPEPTPSHQPELPPTPGIPSQLPQHRSMPEPPMPDALDVGGGGPNVWTGIQPPVSAAGGGRGAASADPAPPAGPPVPPWGSGPATPPTPAAPPPPPPPPPPSPQLPEVPEVSGLDASDIDVRRGVQGVADPARLIGRPDPPSVSGQPKPSTPVVPAPVPAPVPATAPAPAPRPAPRPAPAPAPRPAPAPASAPAPRPAPPSRPRIPEVVELDPRGLDATWRPGAGTTDPAPLAAPPVPSQGSGQAKPSTPAAPPLQSPTPEVPALDPRGLEASVRDGVQGIEDLARLGAPPVPPMEPGPAPPSTPAVPTPRVSSMPHGDAVAAAGATTADGYVAALRRPGVDPGGGVGGRWDHHRFDRYPPGEKWRPGDPINAPHQTEGGVWEYPDYNDQGRPRAWRNLAHFELEDRQRTGRKADPNSIDPIEAMSDADLHALRTRANSEVRSPRNRLGEVIELEHVGVPQRVAKALTELGFSASESRRLTGASDPGNLLPVTGPEHAFFDANAHRRDAAGQKFQHTQASDVRKERPLAPLTDAEIQGLVDLINQRGFAGNFGRTRRTRNLRDWLRREIQDRGLAITL